MPSVRPSAARLKGSLKTVRADDLAAMPIRALIERNPERRLRQTDDVLMGAASAIGEQGYNVGRNASLLAGIDHHVPGCTVNRFCASSLQTIRMAFHAIKAGEGDQYIAAGVEAVSRAGLGAGMMDEAKQPEARRLGRLALRRLHPHGADGRERRRALPRHPRAAGRMGGDLPEPRRRRAATPATSTPRSCRSPVPAHKDVDKEGNEIDVPERSSARRRPAAGDDDGGAGELKPAFRPDGTVTAGNACPLNDGAAAVLVMSDEKASALGLKPRARIIASTVAAIRPEIMGLGPIPAIQALLKQTGMTIDDVDIVEINEAFAAQIVPCMRGAGDPRGASSTRSAARSRSATRSG